ncbi:hypothetical protein CEXT_221751 [Caerostris extrusa]|uniref:Ribosomal protein L2 n=1 Tax=Caerostris extrusa TaxID=172846 RepID=A0AAV4PIF6_CAEEX|nr:hypothetical protein CEXT_221751 [Caerostris extrusa]
MPKTSFLAITTRISVPRKRKHRRNSLRAHLGGNPKAPRESIAKLFPSAAHVRSANRSRGNLPHPTGTGGKGKVISNLSLAPTPTPCSLMSLHSPPNETKCYL